VSGVAPILPEERDERVADLATGFALNELEEDELSEFHDRLCDAQGGSERAARIAWEALGMVTDLRAEVGSGFQDTLRHRLQHDQTGRFQKDLRRRLGFSVPSLEPVAPPPPSRSMRVVAWLVTALACALAAGLAWIALSRWTGRATVSGLVGEAQVEGQALVPGSTVSHRRLTVQTGGQVGLSWSDGTTAVIAGRAEAEVQSRGLALSRGRAWLSARNGFDLILPDRTCAVAADDTSVACEIVDERSFIGVRTGALSPGRKLADLTDHQGLGPSGSYGWRWDWDAAAGTLNPGHPPPPDWRLVAEVGWADVGDTATLAFTGAGKGAMELRCLPGLLVVVADGREAQRLVVPGSPLLGYRLRILQRDGRTMRVELDNLSLSVPVPEAMNHYQTITTGGAAITVSAFHPLPDPRPPQPVVGW
jgi:hypothetical protein